MNFQLIVDFIVRVSEKQRPYRVIFSTIVRMAQIGLEPYESPVCRIGVNVCSIHVEQRTLSMEHT